jgi:hypothetical protein
MRHFTYSENTNNSVLRQGDILEKSEALKSVIASVHPYFSKDDYKCFVVLTQSCDLVRRDNNQCSAQYITIAAVRSLDEMFNRYISRFQKTKIEKKGRICDKKNYSRISQFTERLFNNNEEEYFYLEQDLELGLQESLVAFLRLSIALKVQHYDICLSAKKAEMADIFSAKLGWMVGKMYSRIGTPDWVPDACNSTQFEGKCKRLLDSNVLWVDSKALNNIREKDRDVDNFSETDIREMVSTYAKPKKRDIAQERIMKIVSDSGFVESQNIGPLVKRIMNDLELASSVWKENA